MAEVSQGPAGLAWPVLINEHDIPGQGLKVGEVWPQKEPADLRELSGP